MEEVHIFQDKIIYKEGWFVYIRQNGLNSVLTRQAVHKVEEDYYCNQVRMSVDKGGASYEAAYSMYGFKKKGENYVFFAPYKTDRLGDAKSDKQVSETMVIPEKIDGIEINCVSRGSFADIDVLKEVILPENIKIIERDAFKNCHNLQKVQFLSKNLSIERDAFFGTGAFITDSNKVSYIGTMLIKADTSLAGEYCIKDGTVSIADNAFSDCEKLTKVRMPESVKSIGKGAFKECSSLQEVVFPDYLTQLGDWAFYKCSSLKSVCIPAGIKRLERATFEECTSLSEVHLPTTLTFIGFDSLRNTEIVNRFQEEKEPALYIDHWLICYKEDFDGELHIKPGTIGIADSLLYMGNRELSKIELPEGIRYLGGGCFEGCYKITHILLPEGIETIGRSVFNRCKNLKTVVFPKSLKKLDIWNIMHCEAIEEITFLNPETEIIWPAITDREDKKEITVIGYKNSTAEKYCEQYGEKYGLKFRYRRDNT